ncbi:hypothetical protein [Rhizobium sp. ZPR3]|uniref:Uncharacterized protein n=2 Tax=unclassified Rhizobium TaxID=2613769 RepID=A0AAU7S7Z6_9HYPH
MERLSPDEGEISVARVNYDTLAGALRVASVGKEPSAFAVAVLTYHAALEVELDVLLVDQLPRPEKILTGRGPLNFAQKAAVINAAWRGDPEGGDVLERVLVAFNELRNAVAHNDKKQVKACYDALVKSYKAIDPDVTAEPPLLYIALGICGFMGDEDATERLMKLFDKVDDATNKLAKVFGSDHS